jgi:hypothetical protein
LIAPFSYSRGRCTVKARAMANILASQSVEMRLREALIKQADRLLCESWNEWMWSDGEPIDPPPTITRPSTAAFHGWKSSVRGASGFAQIWGTALDDGGKYQAIELE